VEARTERAEIQLPKPDAPAPGVKRETTETPAGRTARERPDEPERLDAGPRSNPQGTPPAASVIPRSELAQGAATQQPASRERAAAATVPAEPPETVALRQEPARTGAVRELSVVLPGRLSASGKPESPVEVRVVERTGDVRVAVRTGDSRLTDSLREDLPQLVSQLADRGYRAETWHPAATPAAAESGRASGSEPSRDGNTSGHSGRGGSDTSGRGGDGERRQQEQNPPEWLAALERSLGRESASIGSIQ
jgi:hypothetical protein